MLSPAFGAEQPAGKCDVGPLHKTYGKASWLVYSCTTDKNVILVSAPGNPAFPFVFCFCMKEGSKDGSYHLYGEGTGNKEASGAAFERKGPVGTIAVRRRTAAAGVRARFDQSAGYTHHG